MTPRRDARAASGVMALIFLSLIAVLSLAAIIQYTNAMYTAQQLQEERAKKIQESIELSRAITAVWTYDTLTGTLTLNVTNNHAEPVRIPAAVIIYPDKSYKIWRLDHTLSPGETHTHTLNTPAPATVKLAALGTLGSASTVIAQNTTNTGTGSTGPTWTLAQSLPPPIITQGAATWYGNAIHLERINITSQYEASQVLHGTPQGNPADMQLADNNNFTVESTGIALPPQLILKENNTIIWDDFVTNPIATGRLIPLDPTAWFFNVPENIYRSRLPSPVPPPNSAVDFAYVDFTQYGYSQTTIPPLLLNNGFYVVTKMDNRLLSPAILALGNVPSCVGFNVYDSLFHGIMFSEQIVSTAPARFYQIGQCFTDNNGYIAIRRGVNQNLVQNLAFNIHPNLGHETNPYNMILIAYYKQGNMHAKILEWNNEYSVQLLAPNTAFTPRYVGLSTSGFFPVNFFGNLYYSGGYFDFIYITEGDPLNIIVEGPPGYTVRLFDSNNNFISQNSTYDPTINGYRLRIYNSGHIGPVFKPVFQGTIEVRDNVWNLVASYTGTIMGGSVYQLILGPLHRAEVEVNLTNPGTGVSILSQVFPITSISSNVSSTLIELLAYDFQAGTYVTIASATGSLGNASIVLSPDFIEAPANRTRLIINASDSVPFRLDIDLANTVIEGLRPVVKKTLVVGHDDKLDVFEVDDALSPPTLNHLYTLTWTALSQVGTLGGIAVVNSTLPPPLSLPVTYVFATTNTSGVQAMYALLDPNGFTTPAAGGTSGLIVETIRDAGLAPPPERVIILRPGTASTDYFVLDTSPGSMGSLLDQGSIVGLTVWNGYYASAYDGTNTYVLLYNTTSGALDLVRLVYQSTALPPVQVVSVVEGLGFLNPVGMAVDDAGDLLVMLEGGPLVKIDLPSGTVTPISVALPFLPFGPGDRLEVVGGRPLFVRAYGSNDVWVLT